jgi:CheY-like chemotaxis protein
MPVRKILVVDDSNIIHKMYDILLEGHTVVHAFSGREALLSLVDNRDVALILLDLNMPQMSGLEVLQRIQGNGMLAKIPVIVVSSDEKMMDTMECLRAGALAYLRKPIRPERLRSLVNDMFGVAALRRPASADDPPSSRTIPPPGSWRDGVPSPRAPSSSGVSLGPTSSPPSSKRAELPSSQRAGDAMEELRATRRGDRG